MLNLYLDRKAKLKSIQYKYIYILKATPKEKKGKTDHLQRQTDLTDKQQASGEQQ